ncbi:unnamed protein product [Ectocarpus sp. 12 AP-2014]
MGRTADSADKCIISAPLRSSYTLLGTSKRAGSRNYVSTAVANLVAKTRTTKPGEYRHVYLRRCCCCEDGLRWGKRNVRTAALGAAEDAHRLVHLRG